MIAETLVRKSNRSGVPIDEVRDWESTLVIRLEINPVDIIWTPGNRPRSRGEQPTTRMSSMGFANMKADGLGTFLAAV